ncbi:membrane protein [Amycolatopsis taiwanensis]|uniref:Membrane protein n=1 Tax=Amycolatopsis taiwanensis TaxID=342230 RepID=A0A9W6R4J4_9PSEU|nr:membrane protein [Amycolatopsis taiwanensis]GLY69349.1 membrane protein [Amycolatopsis taiwanensis]
MLGWFCVTLGVAFSSAIVPLINIEMFVLGLVASQPQLHWALVAAAVAIGQVAGKLLYYLAARGSIRLPGWMTRVTRRRTSGGRWRERTKWLRAKIEALRERCHRHPAWMAGTYGVSAVVGIPPFMATVVLAGLADMSMPTFLTAGLAGRFVRYAILAAFPAIFASWTHHW